jgi:hypothetical protein
LRTTLVTIQRPEIKRIKRSCKTCKFRYSNVFICLSQWSRGLRRSSAAARLLRLWFRFPPGDVDVCLLLIVVRCQVEVSATRWSLVKKSRTDCGASLSVI